MTIVLPKNYHAKAALEKRRVHCVDQDEAFRRDIRPLRIGILNIMPKAETYESSLLFPLGRRLIQIIPVWIRLENHRYNSSDKVHIDSSYVSFEEAVSKRHLDGLIISGAPVEDIDFEDITYWDEVRDIMSYARDNIASTLGVCWGGLALSRFLGIEKLTYKKKLFGVFELENIDRGHRITGELDDIFWCPLSSHSGIDPHLLEGEAKKGNINLLAKTVDKGDYIIYESGDSKFIIHLGHPEYEAGRLVEEYIRDKEKERDDVFPPANVNLDKPLNRWRGHCLEFYSQWIKYVYETTPF